MDALEPILNIAKAMLGIGGLIFVHELGHFLVGRWCGVRAEAFSIGFGPVLWKWQPGETEYRLSAFPLGGYVKFLAENPGETGALEPDSFPAATYARKAAIMLAGVTMNILAALVLFVWGYSLGVERPAPIVGQVLLGSVAWEHGLERGDEFVTIDGNDVLEFDDIRQATLLNDEIHVVLRRGGTELAPIRMAGRVGSSGLRQLGIRPPVVINDELVVFEDTPAHAAGFRMQDRVRSVEGEPVSSVEEALAIHRSTAGPTRWTVERDGREMEISLEQSSRWLIGATSDNHMIQGVRHGGPAEQAGLLSGDHPLRVGARQTPTWMTARRAVLDPQAGGPLVVHRGGREVDVPLPESAAERAAFAASFASVSGKEPLVSPTIREEGPNPLADAGVEPGSRILSLGGKPIEVFTDIDPIVQEAGKAGRSTLTLRWRDPGGAEHSAEIAPFEAGPEMTSAGFGQRSQMTLIRETNMVAAIGLGLDRTHRWVMRIFSTLGSIFTGGVSPTKLSGPLAIAKISYDTAESGTAQFVLFLGMISINLAVLNILPIPLLDGGQLAVITAEKVYGKELPEPLLAGLQWTGLVLLLGLMVFVIANDIVNFAS